MEVWDEAPFVDARGPAAFAAVPASIAPGPAVVVAKSCSSGYTHGVVPGGAHKCLRAGEFCSRKSFYHRVYRFYKNKGLYCPPSGHLRRR
jgi:hypothetical protein